VLLVSVGGESQIGTFFTSALKELRWPYAYVDENTYRTFGLADGLSYHLFDKRPLRYRKFNHDLVDIARRFQPTLLLVTKGLFVSPNILDTIKRSTGAVLINYATDDPFNCKASSRELVRAIPMYDIYLCTKTAIMEDVRAMGCPHVSFVPFGYDPELHFPEASQTIREAEKYRSDVVFIGGADEDRYPFFEALIEAIPTVDLRLYGGYWERNPRLKAYASGYVSGREYRLAMSGAKIAPCLVRRANRDGHVMRSFEIPACRTFMLSERTKEHALLFTEGEDVDCFSTPRELAEKVRYYLRHEDERLRMAESAYKKVTSGSNTYKDRLMQIVRSASHLREC
jgi:spore maturation protein CgeB